MLLLAIFAAHGCGAGGAGVHATAGPRRVSSVSAFVALAQAARTFDPIPVSRAARVAISGAVSEPSARGLGTLPGLELIDVLGRPELVGVLEAPARGRGAAVLRRAPFAPYVVQTPHTLSEPHVSELGAALFERLRARAWLFDTTHRYRGANCPESPEAREGAPCASDVAHTAGSTFHVLHEALLESDPSSTIVALHGAADRAGRPDVIVSHANTRARVEPLLAALRRALGPELTVAGYGLEVHELGGTTGVQARHVRARGGAMLHLELSRRLREALRGDAAARARFIDAVVEGLAVARAEAP